MVGGMEGVVDVEEEEEEEEEEELLLLVALLVKGVMDGVGMSLATFCFFVPLSRALMFHPRTDASLTNTKAMWNPVIGMDGNKKGGHIVQPNENCYITPAFSGAHNWAELPHDPCVLRGPQQRGQH